ncbi:ROK family protein [Vallitalea guaymasensis]|uniref:ROK family protein n=1 Tax=Vallitalea guaymasensis TaxID=1185412 RepID=A0A8J8M9L2_9FIRM|nr:ROK family protein [Vallitalea guaymasensis]QUH28906.1 ROK family protein [Vallitalea guaymasensis]
MKIGIDLGGTTMSAGIVDEKNIIIDRNQTDTNSSDSPEKVIQRMANLVNELIEKTDIKNITHIGIGCPGMLDRQNGIVLYSNNIGWENIHLIDAMKKYFHIPVYLENDANCAALGEYIAGAGKKYSSMVMVTLGTGIGGGIIIDDTLYRGKNGNSSILGHLMLVDNGELCTCGRKGCWEAYGSVSALIRMANEKADEYPDSELEKQRKSSGRLDGRNIFDVIHNGDKAANEVLVKYISNVAQGIVDIVNILDPEGIVIGGGISKQGEFILEPIRKIVKENIYCKSMELPKITASGLGNNAGIIGAACLDQFV